MIDPTSLESLSTRLRELEQRVAMLERGQPAQGAAAASPSGPSPLLPSIRLPEGAGFFPVAGRAMLGIAGAYLLRAVGQAHWIPEALLAPVAVAYALAWLLIAVRSTAAAAYSVYASTSVVILAPMLWELTMRFHSVPAWGAALALAAMAAMPFAVPGAAARAAQRRIAAFSAAVLALVLAITTHDNLPFLAVLLMIVALDEAAAMRGRTPAWRGLLALAADLGVWMLIYIYRGPAGGHADYPAISSTALIVPGFLLLATAAAGVAHAACVRRERVAAFTTLQTLIAYLLAAWGLIEFGGAEGFLLLGTVCLALAACVYAALLTVVRSDDLGRNRALFATWAAALFLAGSFFCAPEQARPEWLGLSAVAATFAGARSNLFFLLIHGNLFLLASASGLLAYAARALTGTPSGAPSIGVCFVLVCAIACYAAAQRGGSDLRQAASYVPAAVAVAGLAAMLVQGMFSTAALAFIPGPHHLALMRSFAVCLAALLLVLAGSAAQRRELIHLAYAALLLEAVKLIAEDLRHGRLAYVAGSVCIYAVTLILLPHLKRRELRTGG